MYGYGLSCAFPILTKTGGRVCSGERQMTCRRVHLPNFATWCWSVPCIFNHFHLVFCSSLFLLKQVLTHFRLILVQKAKGLNRTSESCMWEIWILCSNQRYLWILMGSSGHFISYSVVIQSTPLGGPSDKPFSVWPLIIVHWCTTSQFPSP